MSKEQAAAESEPEATQSGQEEGEQDDLDALLAEHDQESTQPQPQPSTSPQVGGSDPRIEQIWQKMMADETNKAVSKAVKQIKEFIGSDDLDDDFVETHLRGTADKYRSVALAFVKREENPSKWNDAIKLVAKGLKKYVPKGDDDREAVTAAVKSGSSAKPEPERDFPSEKELRKMSDRDFSKIDWGD